MRVDAVILGASGYGGGELLRWLSQHPNVGSVRGTSRSLAGQSFAEAHPNLRGVVEGEFVTELNWSEAANATQLVVFSALPHGELAKMLPELETGWSAAGLSERLLLIDLSTDFRADERFVYGMPEWNRTAMVGAKRIACAGCFATALQLALLPLRGLDVGFIAASAVTGSSGSGMAATAGTHHPTRANDFRAYKVLTHQHLAEIEMAMRACAIGGRLSFVPHSGPFVRGIFATLQFALPAELDGSGLLERAQQVFAGSPFIRIVEQSPRVAAVTGTNFADVSVAAGNGSGAIMVALDNLGKGMAGQAVQVMNIALGLPEITGLWHAGRYPG
jgi:LysW-gamma-L-alpha-aminoadipyl-6-phosphate/LysW-L-glutamyl-5-phosphate reductase